MAVGQIYLPFVLGPRIIMGTADNYFRFDCGLRIIIPNKAYLFPSGLTLEDHQGNGKELNRTGFRVKGKFNTIGSNEFLLVLGFAKNYADRT